VTEARNGAVRRSARVIAAPRLVQSAEERARQSPDRPSDESGEKLLPRDAVADGSALARRRVERLASLGLDAGEIANLLAIKPAELRKLHGRELARGKLVANALVARALFRRALGSGPQATSAAIFWLKNQGGWGDGPGDPLDDPAQARRVTFWIDSPGATGRGGGAPDSNEANDG
jgi:hypothetical protein